MGSESIQLRRNKFYDPFAQIDRNINGTERHKNNTYICALGRQQFYFLARKYTFHFYNRWYPIK